MDCDLQDRPEEIPRLYAKAREGYEVVIASRSQNSGPLLKRFASWLFYRLFSWLADMDYDARAGNYRMISRNVVATIRQMREQLRPVWSCFNWTGSRPPVPSHDLSGPKGADLYFAQECGPCSQTIVATPTSRWAGDPLRVHRSPCSLSLRHIHPRECAPSTLDDVGGPD